MLVNPGFLVTDLGRKNTFSQNFTAEFYYTLINFSITIKIWNLDLDSADKFNIRTP